MFRRNERNKNHLIAYTLLLSHGTHQQTQIAQKVTKYFIIRIIYILFLWCEQGNNSSVAHRKWTESIFSLLFYFCFTWYIQFEFVVFFRTSSGLWNCERIPIIKWEQPLFYIHVSLFRSKFMAVLFFTLPLLCATKNDYRINFHLILNNCYCFVMSQFFHCMFKISDYVGCIFPSLSLCFCFSIWITFHCF